MHAASSSAEAPAYAVRLSRGREQDYEILYSDTPTSADARLHSYCTYPQARIKPNTFCVKGGGHAMNPGFSSVRGVQISRSRFNGTNTKVDFTSGIVEVWAGLTWNQVYATLEPTGE
ncbi:hypothetical protein BGY98DRAFT_964925 [Russula aff. rugulosa BPL654]|nr:hypothetical protein BGY98DRAFT_964925 [Russula aff. rugulosa BPL654]